MKPKPQTKPERKNEECEHTPVAVKDFDEFVARIVRVPPPPKPKK